MADFATDMGRIQALTKKAYSDATGLTLYQDPDPEQLQRRLERTADFFERATLAVRRMCETHSPGVGGYGNRPAAPRIEAAGGVELLGYGWLHIRVNTLLDQADAADFFAMRYAGNLYGEK